MSERPPKRFRWKSAAGDKSPPETDRSLVFDTVAPEIMARSFAFMDISEQCKLRRVSKGFGIVLTWNAVLRHVVLDMPKLTHLKFEFHGLNFKGFSEETGGFLLSMRRLGPYIKQLSVSGMVTGSVNRQFSPADAKECLLVNLTFKHIRRAADTEEPLIKLSLINCKICLGLGRDPEIYYDIMGTYIFEGVRSLTMTDLKLHLCFESSAFSERVSFKIAGPLQIDLHGVPKESKTAAVEKCLLNWGEGHAHLEHPELLIEQWPPECALGVCWEEVKSLIPRRKNGAGISAVDPGILNNPRETVDSKLFPPTMRLELGFLLKYLKR